MDYKLLNRKLDLVDKSLFNNPFIGNYIGVLI